MFIQCCLKPLLKNNKQSNLLMTTKKKLNLNYNPIIGSSIGIPLNLLQYIYTTTYYGENVINLELFLLQFAIGIFTYGTDRLYDALEYNNSEFKNNITIFSVEKIDYYENVLYNYNYNIIFIFASYIYILYILLPHINTYPLLITLTSTLDYRNFKKKNGNLKSIYIGLFWTLGCVFLPCILISDNYSIINNPTIYLSSFFSMFGSSTLLDIKDIIEDKNENINTIPVLYGENNAIIISHSALLIAMITFSQNENFYNNYFLSGLYEFQILTSFFLNFKKNNKA